MPLCTIMRGVSGSGKTTWVDKNRPHALVSSADYFWPHIGNGVYMFDLSRLAEAHEYCREVFQNIVAEGKDVVLDNTNHQCWMYKNYIWLAEQFGYDVEIIELHPPTRGQVEQCWERGKHGVPLDIIIRQDQSWEDDPKAVRVLVEF